MASFALLLMAWTSDQAYFKRLGPVLVTSKCSSLDFFLYDLGFNTGRPILGSVLTFWPLNYSCAGNAVGADQIEWTFTLIVKLNAHFFWCARTLRYGIFKFKVWSSCAGKIHGGFLLRGRMTQCISHVCYAPSGFLFGMECLWTLKNKVGIGVRI